MPTLRKRKTENTKQAKKELERKVKECKVLRTRGSSSSNTPQNEKKGKEKKTKSVEKVAQSIKTRQSNVRVESGKESNLKKTQSAIKLTKVKQKEAQKKENKCETSQNTSRNRVNLRTRRGVKYAESSLEVSQKDNSVLEVSKKVPVYKQQVFDDNNKKNSDQYEFDSDTEKNRKRKRKSDDSFKEYDKTIKRIVKNAVNKTKKRQKKVIFADKNAKNVKVVQNSNKLAESLLKSPSEINILSNQSNKQQPKRAFNKQFKNKENLKPDNTVKNFEAPQCTNPKIQIISNVLLKPNNELNDSVASPDLFKNTKPDANSTMINNCFSPWRFDNVLIRRNPHFIRVKSSSLPSMDQEMVLDHTVVDKFESLNASHIQNTPKQTPKRTVQSKISSFILREHNDNQSNIQNVSIFSNLSDSFSPKVKSPEKRDLNVTTFGFSDVENDKENFKSPVKNKEDRPFRVSINVNDRKYERKKRKVQFKKTETLPSSDEESDEEIEGEVEEHGRLFEDVEDVNSKKNAAEEVINFQTDRKKRTKKNKPKDYDSIHHIRKKDVRTKQEEEEAEKWASAFNSMCEEIEQFPLEIE